MKTVNSDVVMISGPTKDSLVMNVVNLLHTDVVITTNIKLKMTSKEQIVEPVPFIFYGVETQNSDVVKMVKPIRLILKDLIVDVNTLNTDVAQIVQPTKKTTQKDQIVQLKDVKVPNSVVAQIY